MNGRLGPPGLATCLLLACLSCLCVGERYDRDAITFSPDGSLLQVDYAARAVGSSSLCVGLRCKDGVVLAVDRLIPKADAALLSVHKRKTAAGRVHPVSRIQRVDDRTALLVAGMPADGLAVAEQARREARHFRQQFGEEAPGRSVASAVASYLHDCATRADRRVLASAALVASLVEGRAELFSVDTFASLLQCRGAAFGTQSAEVREELAKRCLWDLTCTEAVREVVAIMGKVAAEEGEAGDVRHSIEVAYMSDESRGQLVRDPDIATTPQPAKGG